METKTTNKAEALKEAYKVERMGQLKTSVIYWGSDDCSNLDWYLTPKKAEALKNGSLTKAEAVEIAKARELKKISKEIESKNNFIDEVMSADDLKAVTISVNWVRSRTWGANPHAVAQIKTAGGHYYEFEGTASGCGYDKESASIGEALNQSKAVLKMLYNAKAEQIDKDNRSALGYGSGYGVLPYFEGGVGVSCFIKIFEALGFELIASSGTNNSNFYSFIYTGNKKPVCVY